MIYVLFSMLESCMLGLILVMINLVRNLNLQLSIFPTLISQLERVDKQKEKELRAGCTFPKIHTNLKEIKIMPNSTCKLQNGDLKMI